MERYPAELVLLARSALRDTLATGLWVLTGCGAWALIIFRAVPRLKVG